MMNPKLRINQLIHKKKLSKPLAKPNEQILIDGAHYYDALIRDFDNAKKSIDLETYIFHKDHLGKRITDALVCAAQRGVRVRVLVDGAGSPYWGASYARKLEKAGANTRVFHPFPWQLWHWSRSFIKAPLLLKWIYLLLKVNFRNHRKVCLIDKEIAYVGSFNVSKCHLSKEDNGDNWRDTAIRITNIPLNELHKAFDAAWHHRTIKERVRDAFKQLRRDPIIRVNYTRHRRRLLYKDLLRKMLKSKQRIWITNAYFVPDNFLLRRLREAALRGIDVRILLPKKSDIFMMPWASSTFYYSLLKAGVRIFEYLPSMLHAKSLIIDDWMLVGSSNLNHRSLLHDLEVDIHLTRSESKNILEKSFLQDIKNSREISLQSWQIDRPRRQRIMGWIILYFKYWI